MRKDDARKLDHKSLEEFRVRAPELVEGAASSRWRKSRDHRPGSWGRPVDRVRMAGALSAWRLEWFEGEALVGTSPATRRQEGGVGLRHGDAEESAAIDVRVCAVDARDGRDPST